MYQTSSLFLIKGVNYIAIRQSSIYFVDTSTEFIPQVPMQVFKTVQLSVRTEQLLPASELYYLVLTYLSSSGPMLSITSFGFEMHYHIGPNPRLLSSFPLDGRIISRRFEPSVVASMSVRLASGPNASKVKLDKAFFLATSPTLIVSFCGMMKVVVE